MVARRRGNPGTATIVSGGAAIEPWRMFGCGRVIAGSDGVARTQHGRQSRDRRLRSGSPCGFAKNLGVVAKDFSVVAKDLGVDVLLACGLFSRQFHRARQWTSVRS
jgi:hypothetical protein